MHLIADGNDNINPDTTEIMTIIHEPGTKKINIKATHIKVEDYQKFLKYILSSFDYTEEVKKSVPEIEEIEEKIKDYRKDGG